LYFFILHGYFQLTAFLFSEHGSYVGFDAGGLLSSAAIRGFHRRRRALDPDHLCAEVSQQIRSPRACEDVSEVQYPAARREGPSGHHPTESTTMPPHRRDAL